MRKNELNNLLREFSKKHLSPTQSEQALISRIYTAFKEALGGSTLMIGSFARYTANRPIHDLDILYIDGKFDPSNLHPESILAALKKKIETNFKNPTQYEFKISLQTHSITVSFLEKGEEFFSVDVVPALTSGILNEFKEDIYWVPEILRFGPRQRRIQYPLLSESLKNESDWWIKSDPRGYITAAGNMNKENPDFRKATKIIKAWKHQCKEKLGEFKLKSFHIEWRFQTN